MPKVLHWRPVTKQKVRSQNFFFCPKCNNPSPYVVKHASADFRFYFIPLFETQDLDEFVVCQVCKRGFDPRVLSPGNQSLFRLAWVTKCGLRRSSPEALKSHFLEHGLKEPLVDKLIMLAQN